MIIHNLDAADLTGAAGGVFVEALELIEHPCGWRSCLRIGDTLKGIFEILRCHRAAIVELRIAQMKCPDCSILGWLPALRDTRLNCVALRI